MDTFIIDDNLIERIDSTYNLSFKTMDKEKLNNFILKAKRINLSIVNTSKVWCMTGLFMCTNLEELDISSFDTSEVLIMTSMFYKSNIKNLIGLNKLDTSKVANLEEMFMDNITQLSVVDLIRQCKAEIILPKHRKTANLVKKEGK